MMEDHDPLAQLEARDALAHAHDGSGHLMAERCGAELRAV